jgi:hypothetical protein
MDSVNERVFAQLSREAKREWMRAHKRQCAMFPEHMLLQDTPAHMQERVINTWRSRHHLAVAWVVPNAQTVLCRLTVNRTYINESTGKWLEGILWDDLYRIKNECGFDKHDAVEVFPMQKNLVNVANMRHLWILKEPLPAEFDLG